MSSQTNWSYSAEAESARLDKFNNQSQAKTAATLAIPTLMIGFLLIFGALIAGLVMSPATLINHFAENLIDKFNYQEPSLDARSTAILETKLTPQSTSKYKLLNQYAETTPELVDKLEQQGFEVKINDKNQIEKLKFNNREISSTNLSTELNQDIKLFDAKNLALASRMASFSDQVWKSNATVAQVHKRGFEFGESASDLAEQELEFTDIKQNQLRFNLENSAAPADDENNQNLPQLPEDLKANLAAANQSADKINEQKTTPDKVNYQTIKLLESDFAKTNGICGVYQTNVYLKNYAKTKQQEQQVKLAMLFLTTADKIKAGAAEEQEITYFGERLTRSNSSVDASGQTILTKSGTDSYGYNLVAHDFVGAPDLISQKYILGAPPAVAEILTQTEQFFQTVPGKAAASLCNIADQSPLAFANFFNNIGNFISRMFMTDDLIARIEQLFSGEQSFNLSNSLLASMTGRKTAPDLLGEDFSNSIVGGASILFGRNAALGGNNILTKTETVAYLARQQQIVANRQQLERQTKSPFDASSSQTFVGKLNLSLAGLSGKHNFDWLTNFAKITNQSMAILSPAYQAKALANSVEQFNFCRDPDLQLAEDLAIDPFCGYAYGLPESVLNLKTKEVIDQLVAKNHLSVDEASCNQNGLNCDLVEGEKMQNWRKNCLNRTVPLGLAIDDFSKGEECVSNPDSNLFGVYEVDRRINQISQNKQEIAPASNNQTSLASAEIEQTPLEPETEISPQTPTKLWPVPGHSSISSNFGHRIFDGKQEFHRGIDIPAPSGAGVITPWAGKITFAGESPASWGYGIRVDVDHGSGKLTRYAHLSAVSVKTGDQVKAGQTIGKIGSTGRSTGPHLHFEIVFDDQPKNPLNYLSKP